MQNDKRALERVRSADEPLFVSSEYSRPMEYVDGYGYPDTETDAGLDLSKFAGWFRAVLKRKWLVAAVVLIGTTVVTIEMYRRRDTYQASTVVEVGKESTSLGPRSGDWIGQDDDDPVARHNLKTKMFVLKSTPLLESVVIDLKLDRNQRFLSDLDPVRFGYKKKSYREAIESIGDRLTAPAAASANKPPADLLTAPASVVGDSKASVSPQQSERLEPLVDVIRANLGVEQVADTRLLKVSFTHTDPDIAATFCNYLVQSFIVQNFEGKTEKLSKASEWLDKTTLELKEKVESAERSLATYTREHNIFATPTKGSLIIEKLTKLHAEVTRAESERIVKSSLYDQVKQGKIAQIPEAFSDPKTAELHRKLGELVSKAAQFDVYYGPENPQTLEVQGQIASMQSLIGGSHKALEEKFKTDYERSVRDEQAFRNALEVAKAEAVQENQDAIQYNILLQEVDTAKLLYKDFLQKTSQTSFELARERNNLRVVEPARVPRISIGPQRKQWILIGLALSLALGVGCALLLDFFDHTIRNIDDVSRHLQLPALAIIPTIAARRTRLLRGRRKEPLRLGPSITDAGQNGNGDDDSLALDGRSAAAEAYRLLRTSVTLSVPDRASRAILITSSQPGEGKTTTTVNTAISLAQLGSSVLIIDCDLRTPKVHSLLGTEQEPGLSTYLSQDVEIDDLIRKLKIPGLSLIPAGPIPHNPAELLGSKRMKDLLEIMSKRYDHILIDSPPLIHLADPVILSTLVDGVIMVVHGGKSTRDVVRRARQELSNVGAHVFGVVLNKVDARNTGYHAYKA